MSTPSDGLTCTVSSLPTLAVQAEAAALTIRSPAMAREARKPIADMAIIMVRRPAVLGGTIGPVRRACSFVAPPVAGSRFTGSM